MNNAIISTVNSSLFIQGPEVNFLCDRLAFLHGIKFVIPCGNGTDALQIALQALDLKQGSEIIVPAFTYVAPVEAAAMLGFKPVFVDVDPVTFNIDPLAVEGAITDRTAAIIAVNLFGQCAHLEALLKIAQRHGLYLIEDNAQSILCEYKYSDGSRKFAGTVGHIGTLSFFPTKNLGCYGDGGAIVTDNPEWAETCRLIANHGQKQKYHYDLIGRNSRLDTIQAAVLNVKLKYLDQYTASRFRAADYYDSVLTSIPGVEIPFRAVAYSGHVFHQYTLKVEPVHREGLRNFLKTSNIPSMVYYPSPMHLQNGYAYLGYSPGQFPVSEQLCQSVLSLPMHTELTREQMDFVIERIIEYYAKFG